MSLVDERNCIAIFRACALSIPDGIFKIDNRNIRRALSTAFMKCPGRIAVVKSQLRVGV